MMTRPAIFLATALALSACGQTAAPTPVIASFAVDSVPPSCQPFAYAAPGVLKVAGWVCRGMLPEDPLSVFEGRL